MKQSYLDQEFVQICSCPPWSCYKGMKDDPEGHSGALLDNGDVGHHVELVGGGGPHLDQDGEVQ